MTGAVVRAPNLYLYTVRLYEYNVYFVGDARLSVSHVQASPRSRGLSVSSVTVPVELQYRPTVQLAQPASQSQLVFLSSFRRTRNTL